MKEGRGRRSFVQGTGAQNVAAPLSPLQLSGHLSPRSTHVDPLIKLDQVSPNSNNYCLPRRDDRLQLFSKPGPSGPSLDGVFLGR
jgi:hypothetical protein